MIIGAHCSMSAPDYLLGAVQEALSYGANALMIYTGPPQNTLRKPIDLLKVQEAQKLLEQNDIALKNIVVHAPYLINLANSVKLETFHMSIDLLRKEMDRTAALGARYLVLHPGSFTTATLEEGIKSIVAGLNAVLRQEENVVICLETMAGKGSEVGFDFTHLQEIISQVTFNQHLAVCLDTCHVHDSGMDLNEFDHLLQQFDQVIGLERLSVLHINDSKNERGARKDRHANIGEGKIGFETLYRIVHHPHCKNAIKILETPWINDCAPYKFEIEMLKSGQYDPAFLDCLRK